MKKVLYVSQKLDINCGIGLIGERYGKALSNSKDIEYIVLYSNNVEEIRSYASCIDAAIYNYHQITTPHLSKLFPGKPEIIIHHDCTQSIIDNYSRSKIVNFDYVIAPNPTLKSNNGVFCINRLLPDISTNEYIEKDIPVIGFQGFVIPHKGLDRIVDIVESEFDSSVINLRVPLSYFNTRDRDGSMTMAVINRCKQSVRKNTEIIFSTEMVSTDEIINIMSQNTLNIYPSHDMSHVHMGLSSSLDYALAAKRPIAVSNASQLRLLHGLTPSICLGESSLKEIISNGYKPYEHLLQLGSADNFISEVNNILNLIGV